MMRSFGSNINATELLLLDEESMVAAALLHSCPLALDLDCSVRKKRCGSGRQEEEGKKPRLCEGTY